MRSNTMTDIVITAVNELTGFSTSDIAVAPDATLMDVVQACIDEEARKTGAPMGELQDASITDDATGRKLNPHLTLADAGVQTGDVIKFMPKMYAAR
ncbi:MAG: hypothetical protein QXH08_05050 [Candidatus Hadarchaeales archaeon]